ncbi:MAG: outer membrane protein assembly factor BamB family protein, partial [Planctomycetota bacterium]
MPVRTRNNHCSNPVKPPPIVPRYYSVNTSIGRFRRQKSGASVVWISSLAALAILLLGCLAAHALRAGWKEPLGHDAAAGGPHAGETLPPSDAPDQASQSADPKGSLPRAREKPAAVNNKLALADRASAAHGGEQTEEPEQGPSTIRHPRSPEPVDPLPEPVIGLLPEETAVEVEAFVGEPFGVARMAVEIPEGQRPPWYPDQLIRIEQPQGRALYPTFNVQYATGEDGSRRRVNRFECHFLFRGDAPFEISLLADKPYSASVVPKADSRGRSTLRAVWWSRYDRPRRIFSNDSGRSEVVNGYLREMLSRRLGLSHVPKRSPSAPAVLAFWRVAESLVRPWIPVSSRRPSPPPQGNTLRRSMAGGSLVFDFDRFLGLLFGTESIRVALEADKRLTEAGGSEPASQPLPQPVVLQAVRIPYHHAAHTEAIAGHVPEDCFYLRCRTLADYLWLRNLVVDWGGSYDDLIFTRAMDHQVRPRIERQLAFSPYAEVREQLDGLISDMAIIGTDVFFCDGAALGVLFEAKDNDALEKLIRRQREKAWGKRPEAIEREIVFGKHKARLLSTPDNTVRSFYAIHRNYHLLTTSSYIARRFFEAGEGRRSLGALREFRYARSVMPAARNDAVFINLSDPFFRFLVCSSIAIVAVGVASADAADWPTFMHDNHRSGVTAESVQPPLALRWVFDSPFPPAKGWAMPVNGYGARKNKPNVSYDDAFRVIAVGDTCYFSSSSEHRVVAVDASTGTIRWSHFTDAAPRLAPAYWHGKLYVGADDGLFRCLDARDGRLLWKIDAAPRQRLTLGHGRFSSLWPIRGAGIVDGGIAFFSTGLFPYHHVYLYAVDAETGSILWRRQLDRGGRDAHAPQGYLLSTADSLFATSRVAPTRWDKRDGSPVDFNTPFPQVKDAHQYRFHNGGSYARIWNGKHLVYGRACILAYDPDSELKDKWGRARKGRLTFNWFGARQILFHDDAAYVATDDHVLAVDQRRLPALAENECRRFEEAYKELRIANYSSHLEEYGRLLGEYGEDHPLARRLRDGPLKWGHNAWQKWPAVSKTLFDDLGRKCRWMTPVKATESFILAGDVLYAGGEDRVYAFNASGGQALWHFNTASRVRGLAAADGRLYVSTVDGKVRCFTAADHVEEASLPAKRIGKRPVPGGAELGSSDWSAHIPESSLKAESILDPGTLDRGYCLIIGGRDAGLAADVARRTSLRVELLTSDSENVDRLRQQLTAAGLHGGRVCVRFQQRAQLPYPPYAFNLVVHQGSFDNDGLSVPLFEVFRVTKPCGGVAAVALADGAEQVPRALAEELKRLEAAGGRSERRGRLVRIVRERLPGSKDWTHNYATAANTYSSDDPLVKGPFGLLWYGEPGPRKRIERHAAPPMPLVVGGTTFTIGYDRVMAFDVYNGLKYWEREIPGATRSGLPFNTSNMAADEQSLFLVVEDKTCLRLDAQSGETMATYPAPPQPDGQPGRWAWIAVEGNRLYGSRPEPEDERGRPSRQKSDMVFALDASTGEPL